MFEGTDSVFNTVTGAEIMSNRYRNMNFINIIIPVHV